MTESLPPGGLDPCAGGAEVKAGEALPWDDDAVLRERERERDERGGDHLRENRLVRRYNVFSGALEADDVHYRPGYAKRGARVGDLVGGERIGGSVYELEDDERVCPYHYHHGVEEWLVVLTGTPTLRTPGGEQVLRAGDTVCFPGSPEGAHTVRGPGRVLMLSANRWPAVVVYPDSDKVGARPAEWGQHDADRLNFRRSDAVDYWEGEE